MKPSGELLYQVKLENNTWQLKALLAGLDMQTLVSGLNNDHAIKTFWLNMNNAWYQVFSVREKMTCPKILTGKKILIAGKKFGLDDIEQGILRVHSFWKPGNRTAC